MKLEEIREHLARDIEKEGYHLFELTYDRKDKILTCLIDESLDLDTIETLSQKISSFMDAYDDELDDYLLDVSSVGLERPIRNETELKAAVGSYIYVKTKEEKYNGTLLAYENAVLRLEYQDKNKVCQVSVPYDKVKKMRYAVKF